MEIGDTVTYQDRSWLLRGFTRRSCVDAQFVHLENVETGTRLVVPLAEIRMRSVDPSKDQKSNSQRGADTPDRS